MYPDRRLAVLTHKPVSLTANLYWSMIESGLGLVAVCLPTFRALFGQVSLDAMTKSFRSAFSLHLPTWQTGWRSKASDSRIELSGGSSEHGKHDHASTLETYAMRTGETRITKERIPEGKIHVQNSIGQIEQWV